MQPTGVRTQRRLQLAERSTLFPPLPVLAAWVYALLTYLITLIISNSPGISRAGTRGPFSTFFPRDTMSLLNLGTVVSFFFLIYLACEYRRTPMETRARACIRGAYLSAVLLMLSCAVLWDGGSAVLALWLK